MGSTIFGEGGRPRRTRWIAVVLLLALLAAAVGVLLGRELSSPAAAGSRPELQRVLDDLVTGDDRLAPGATAYVAGPHGAWTGAAGVSEVEADEPLKPDARMRLESVSKAWTATLVLQLVEDGRMALDDTVAHWLPETLPDGGAITVRQLLEHTSGLIDNNDISRDPLRYLGQVEDDTLRAELERVSGQVAADPAHQFSPELWVRFAAALPLLAEPGTSYHYSNIGYNLAGMIVERVAGAPLATLVHQRIAEPLGLASAAYHPGSDIAGPHALGYAVMENGELVEATDWGTGGIGAEGGIVANAHDEARFLQALMQGRVLGRAALTALKTPSTASGSYGLGLGVAPTGCAGIAFGHNGGGLGFKTSVIVSGDGERVAVLLLNGSARAGDADERVRAAALELFCAA